MKNIFGLFFCLFFIGVCPKIFSQPGTPDSSFNLNGIGTFSFEGSGAISLAIQVDGKIVIGGTYNPTNVSTSFALVRYNIDGSLDNGFGTEGKMYQHIGYGTDEGGYIALQKDGKILIAGDCYDPDTHYLAYSLSRFNSDGTLDKTFNGMGTVFSLFTLEGDFFQGGSVTVQNDQKIIQIGNIYSSGTNPTKGGIVRYNSNGIIDSSFGDKGKVIVDFASSLSWLRDITIQSDGKIVVCGATQGWNLNNINESFFAMARFNIDGTLDESFGNNGKVITCFLPGCISGKYFETGGAGALTIQPDKKIILIGNVWISSDTANSFLRFARYNSNGSLDSTFGNNGKVETIQPLGGANIYSTCLQQDGKIIIAGEWGGGNPYDFFLTRYNINGSLDSSFGTNGYVIKKIDSTDNNSFLSVAMQSDGKIVAAGSSNKHGMVVLRFLSGLNVGVIDLSLKENPILIYPNPIGAQAVLQYTLLQDEKLSIVLYDMLGRQAQTFVTNETRTQGEHKEVLQFSSILTTGNYILSISNGKSTQAVKILKD